MKKHPDCELLHSCTFRGPQKQANDDGHYSGLDFRRTYHNPITGIDYDKIDNFIYGSSDFRVPVTLSIEELSSKLLSKFKGRINKIRGIYIFISTQIKPPEDLSVERTSQQVLRDGEGSSQERSQLFVDLCECCEIDAEIIRGFVKTYDNPEIIGDCNHVWNKVKIKGNWHLLDCSWGGDFHFLTNPKKFVITHLPFHEQDQHVHPPLTKQDFRALFFTLGSRMFEFGIIPDNSLSYRYFSKLRTNYVTLRFRYTRKRSKGGQTAAMTPVIGNMSSMSAVQQGLTPVSGIGTPFPGLAQGVHPFDTKNIQRITTSSSVADNLRKIVSIVCLSGDNEKAFVLHKKYFNYFVVHDYSGGFLIHLFLPFRGLYRVNVHCSVVSNLPIEDSLFQYCCGYCFSVEKQFMYDISFFRQTYAVPVKNFMVLSPVQNILRYGKAVRLSVYLRQGLKNSTVRAIRFRIFSIYKPTAKKIEENNYKSKFLESLGITEKDLVEDEMEETSKKNKSNNSKRKKSRNNQKESKKSKAKAEKKAASSNINNMRKGKVNRNIYNVNYSLDKHKGKRNVLSKLVHLKYFPEDDLEYLHDSEMEYLSTRNNNEDVRSSLTSSMDKMASDDDIKVDFHRDTLKKLEVYEISNSSESVPEKVEFYPYRLLVEIMLQNCTEWEIDSEYFISRETHKLSDFSKQSKTIDSFERLKEDKIFSEILNYKKNKYVDSISRILTISPITRYGNSIGLHLVKPKKPYSRIPPNIPLVIELQFGNSMEAENSEDFDNYDFFLSYRRFRRFHTGFNIFFVNERDRKISTRIVFSQIGKYCVEIGFREPEEEKYRFVCKLLVEVVSMVDRVDSGFENVRTRKHSHGKRRLTSPLLQRFDSSTVTAIKSIIIFRPLFETEVAFKSLYNFLYCMGDANVTRKIQEEQVKEKTIVFSKKEPKFELFPGLELVLSKDISDNQSRDSRKNEVVKTKSPTKQKQRVYSKKVKNEDFKDERFDFIPDVTTNKDIEENEIMKRSKLSVFEHRSQIITIFGPVLRMKFKVGRYNKYGLKFELRNYVEELKNGKAYFVDVGSKGDYNLYFNLPRTGLYELKVLVKKFVGSNSFYLREACTYWIRLV